MIPYRSSGHLLNLCTSFTNKKQFPYDLIVGIPRSGILPAIYISQLTSKPFQSLDAYLEHPFSSLSGFRELQKSNNGKRKKVLIIDDSVNSGREIKRTKQLIESGKLFHEHTYMAVYGTSTGSAEVDITLEYVEYPRLFEWNILNHPLAMESGYDLDGVLCEDPLEVENDDGLRYMDFIRTTRPLFVPKYKIKAIVTSRLEKYRDETELWLARNKIEYDKLVMLKGMTAAERRYSKGHAPFKANVVKDLGLTHFVESAAYQAKIISAISNRQCFCVENMKMYYPEDSVNSDTSDFSLIGNKFTNRILNYFRSFFNIVLQCVQ